MAEYKIIGNVTIVEEECKEFELSLENKGFDFFRYLADNSADIEIKKVNKWAKKSNKKIINSIVTEAHKEVTE